MSTQADVLIGIGRRLAAQQPIADRVPRLVKEMARQLAAGIDPGTTLERAHADTQQVLRSLEAAIADREAAIAAAEGKRPWDPVLKFAMPIMLAIRLYQMADIGRSDLLRDAPSKPEGDIKAEIEQMDIALTALRDALAVARRQG